MATEATSTVWQMTWPKLHALRRTDQLALGLVVVGILAVAVYLATDSLDAWTPNFATEAWSIAATIAIVERIVRREERERMRPRIERTLSELGFLLKVFAQHVLADYWMTHVYTEYEMRGDVEEILKRWVEDAPDDPHRGRNTTPLVLENGRDFAIRAKRLADSDRQDLPAALVAAIDNLDFWLDKTVPPAPDHWSANAIVNGVRPVAAALRPHVDASVFTIYEGTQTYAAVDEPRPDP